jgi:serine/threonine-protein kinase HipA
MCQALGVMPTAKYQDQGGPGIAEIVTLIRRVSTAPEIDVDRFLQANMLNWLIGGANAHAKNYSLLIGAADEIRLAPLYDLSSQLPYAERIPQRLSMKIGEHHDIARVSIADWRKLARACVVREDRVLGMLADMARELPDHISAARDRAIAEGLDEAVVARLTACLISHVTAKSSLLAARSTS